MFSRLSAKHRFLLRLMPVFVLALAIRVLCAVPALKETDRLQRPDSATYLLPAYALAEDSAINTKPQHNPARFHHGPGVKDCVVVQHPAVQRPPGYIVFLAGLRLIFGRSPVAFALAGCLIGALAVFPVGVTGRYLAGRRAGFWAAVLYALNLTSLAVAPLILADTLLGFLVAFQAMYLVKAMRTGRLCDFIPGTVFAAAAVLVKPVNVPVLILLFMTAPFMMKTRRKAVRAMLLVPLVSAVIIVPWMLRNRAVGAGFVIDRNSGLTALHNTAAILAHANHGDANEIRVWLEYEANHDFLTMQNSIQRSPTAAEREEWYLKRYREAILAHPWSAAATHLFQVWILLPDLPDFLQNLGLRTGERGTLAVLRKDGVLAAFRHYMDGSYAAAFLSVPFVLVHAALWLLTAAGIWLYARRKRWVILLVCVLPALYYLAAAGPVVLPRYQIPALPYVCALAGAVISACGIRRWRKRRSSRQCNP
jgi:4-amino-4-deoxy-L-arabinose transferase-like glycosyltransferase